MNELLIPKKFEVFIHSGAVPKYFSGWAFLESYENYCCYLDGQLHRLDGPAVIYTKNKRLMLMPSAVVLEKVVEYWIDGRETDFCGWVENPLTIKYKLDKVLEL